MEKEVKTYLGRSHVTFLTSFIFTVSCYVTLDNEVMKVDE
jgi:hypothetical protein